MSTHHGIFIHSVFSTKFRARVLRDSLRDELFAYISGMLHEHKSTLMIGGGIEDHVHLLLKIHPSFALSNTMQFIKSNSSRWINEGRRINAKFEGQSGYGAFSVSQSMIATVYKYIANQAEHHRTMSFEEEYLQTLRKNRIEYDPKYVFESEHIG